MADMADTPMDDDMMDEPMPPEADPDMVDEEMPPDVETAEPTDEEMAEAEVMDQAGEAEPEPAMTEAQARNAMRRGELDVEGLIAGLRDGSIGLDVPPPAVSYNSPTWWADVDERRSLPPFISLVPAVLSFDDYERVRQVIAERRGVSYAPLPDRAEVSIPAEMPDAGMAVEAPVAVEPVAEPMAAPPVEAEPSAGEAPRFEAPAVTLPPQPMQPMQQPVQGQ